MIFQSSHELGRIPIVVLQSDSLLEQTSWLASLLQHPLMKDTVVLTSLAHRATDLGGARVEQFELGDSLEEAGCLCCGLNRGLGDSLRALFLNGLTKRVKPVARVLLESSGVDPRQLGFTLKHTPFLGQRYAYQMTLKVKDGRAQVIDPVRDANGPVEWLDFDEKLVLKSVSGPF